MLRKLAMAFAVSLLAAGITAESRASLLGQTVSCNSLTFQYDCLPSPAVVDPGISEFLLFDMFFPLNDYVVDIGDNFVEITVLDPAFYDPSGEVVRFLLQDLIWVNDDSATIQDVVVIDTLFEFSQVFIAGPNALEFELFESPGASFTDPFGSLFVEIIPSHGEMPEPATIALFGLGLAGLGLAARRRRVAQ